MHRQQRPFKRAGPAAGRAAPRRIALVDHVVATFLIGADGRVRHRFLGLEHSAEQLAAAVAGLDSESAAGPQRALTARA